MNDKLDFIYAQASVIQLHARYTDAVWRQDIKQLEDCYTPDAQWRIGGTVMHSRNEIVTRMSKVFPTFKRILMTIRNPYVTLTPNGATARTYVTENSIFIDGSTFTAIGVYHDRLVNEGDTWRFSWRLFQTCYLGPADFSGDLFEGNPDFGPAGDMPGLDAITIDHTGMHTATEAEQ